MNFLNDNEISQIKEEQENTILQTPSLESPKSTRRPFLNQRKRRLVNMLSPTKTSIKKSIGNFTTCPSVYEESPIKFGSQKTKFFPFAQKSEKTTSREVLSIEQITPEIAA